MADGPAKLAAWNKARAVENGRVDTLVDVEIHRTSAAILRDQMQRIDLSEAPALVTVSSAGLSTTELCWQQCVDTN